MNGTTEISAAITGGDQDQPLEVTVASQPFAMVAGDYLTIGYTGIPVTGNRTYYTGTRLSLVRIQ
jgi:hypothetical protein